MAYDAQPEWTETPEKRGLDPLGLQAAGIALYQRLLPGISNVTLRIRYYGLYSWLADTYGRLGLTNDPKEWQRWVRRTEALYALAAVANGGEHGVAGVEWAAKALAGLDSEDFVDFAPATETKGSGLYLRNAMGVFGGAYSSQLVEMGFLAMHPDYGMLAPTHDRGEPLAEAFRQSLGDEIEATLVSAIREGRVRVAELGSLGKLLPSRIVDGSKEASIYVDVLFALDADPEQGAVRRRQSLQLVLATADRLGRIPKAEEVRWAMFNGPPGSFGPELEAERLRWEAYQAHDLFQLAYAALLRQAVEQLRHSGAGLAFGDLVERATIELCAAVSEIADGSWGAFVASADGSDPLPMERFLSRLQAHSMPTEAAEAALTLVATLQARVAARDDLAQEIEDSFPPISGSVARSIKSELAFLEGRHNATVREVVRDVVADRVVRRHSQIAMLKFARQRDYTFLFEATEGRLRYRAEYAPVLTTPRLGPAITFLQDLHLIGPQGLTSSSAKLLPAT